jgi:hypothetical protein
MLEKKQGRIQRREDHLKMKMVELNEFHDS